MSANYELWLCDDRGSRLQLVDDFIDLEYALTLSKPGAFSLNLPGDFSTTLLRVDNEVQIWRQPEGGKLDLERVYFMRRFVDQTDRNGERRHTVSGPDSNELVSRRVIWGAFDNSTDMYYTGTAGDMMRQVVNAYTVNSTHAFSTGYWSVESNREAGPSITVQFTRMPLPNALEEYVEAAHVGGQDVYWDVTPMADGKFEFRCYEDQLGQDHTYDSQNPVVLGMDRGNLAEPKLELDYSKEITKAYVVGEIDETGWHDYVEVEDTARSKRSIWGLRETIVDGQNEDSTSKLEVKGQAKVGEGRPKLKFSGKILDVEGTQYGRDWKMGDRVTAIYAGRQYDGIVKAVKVKVDQDGKETVEARVEVEE